VADANSKVFSPQMNLTFAITAVKPLRISQDLGNPVDFKDLYSDMIYVKHTTDAKTLAHITDNGDTTRQSSTFSCLWDFIHHDEALGRFVMMKQPIGASDMEKSGANRNMCMMKDPDS